MTQEVIIVSDQSAAGTVNVSIANGAAFSGNLYAAEPEARKGFRGFSIEIPAVWTAANIGFEYSWDGNTWYKFYSSTKVRVMLTGVPTAERCAMIAPVEVVGLSQYPYVRLVSLNTGTGANENQGAARELAVTFWR